MSDTEPNLTPFDTLTFNNQLQMMKAAIPYTPNTEQKYLSIIVRFLELKNTLNLFEEDENKLSACSVNSPNNNPLDMLNDIRNYCSDEQKASLDLAINFYNAFQMSSYQDASEGNGKINNRGLLENIKVLLPPEQRSMLDTYSTLLNV